VETDDNFRVDLRLDVAGAYGLSSLANFSGNLSLSNTVIDANAAIGTVVGELATVNNDNPGFNHSYQLITDPDDMFEVVGNQLITKKEFNYNQKSSYLVTIRATEENGNKFIDQEFEVNLNNPIFNGRIFLSFKNTYKFLPVGSVVTDIKVNNISNSNAKYNFYLSGTDSKYFKIDGRKLLIAKNLPINKKYLNINIKAEEQNSSFYREQNFSIRILNSLRRDNGDNADSDQAEEDKENEVSKLPQELDHDQNNIIDFSELSKIVINLNQALKLNRKLRKRSFRSVINKVDLNEDSVFDDQDIKEIHKYIDQLPDFNYIRNVLNLIKTNKKGNITFKSSESTIDKFNRAMRNKFKNKDRQAELIKVFDYNSDGKLDQTDLNSLKTVLELGLSRDNIENKSKRINRINRVLKL
jgi:Ca2+-binding EF-hand superfamily protein